MCGDHERKYMRLLKESVLAGVDRNTTTVFLFGSRAAGETRRSSDVDIGVLSKTPLNLKDKLRILGAIEESIVPWHVDLIDFAKAFKSFRALMGVDLAGCSEVVCDGLQNGQIQKFEYCAEPLKSCL